MYHYDIMDIIWLLLTLQMAVKNCFIRGSVVRYVQLPAEHVDTQLLEDATRRGMSTSDSIWTSTDTNVEAQMQAKRW